MGLVLVHFKTKKNIVSLVEDCWHKTNCTSGLKNKSFLQTANAVCESLVNCKLGVNLKITS